MTNLTFSKSKYMILKKKAEYFLNKKLKIGNKIVGRIVDVEIDDITKTKTFVIRDLNWQR